MKTTNSAHAPARCHYRTATGRQCCFPASAPGSAFCPLHSAWQSPDSVDFSAELIDGCGTVFQRAQQINHSFIELYKLLAQGRISPRRAALLAYISGFILRSLKNIDYDNERFGHEDENKDNENPAPPERHIGPGTKPLPATGAEFAAEVLALAAESNRDEPDQILELAEEGGQNAEEEGTEEESTQCEQESNEHEQESPDSDPEELDDEVLAHF